MDYRENTDHPELYESLKALPKIELHRHLEGSLRLGTMAQIASEYKMDLPGYDTAEFRHLVQMMPDDELSANVFLSKFNTLRLFYRSREIIERVAYEAVADAAADNIVYMELRFTPIALARREDFSLSDVTDWVLAATQRAAREHKIDVRLIVNMNRHESVELGNEMAAIAIERCRDGIVGVDLGGAEHQFSGEPFAPVFHKARKAGLNITIHAGEWAGPERVREAIDVLGATRLGHGVRVIEDSDLVRVVKDRGIPLEVCLTSNWQTGVVPSLAQHPLRDLYQIGLRTTLNTDDPSLSAINLTDEFVRATKYLNLSLDDLKQHVLNAAEASFLTDAEKTALSNRLKMAFDMKAAAHPKS